MALRVSQVSGAWARVPPALRTFLCCLILFTLNAYIALRLFQVEYFKFMGSIDAAYISLTRYILAHPFDWTWFPLWYTGVPFENTYPPLLHLTVAATAWLGDFSPARAHHFVSAAMYCLGPVTLFALARRLSGSRAAGLAAGLFYSLVSPSAFLMPVTVAKDVGSFLGPRRFQTLPLYGEGPHMMALTLLPLAILLLDRALDKPRPLRLYAAALAVAAVPLTNWLGAFALAIGAACLLLARSDAGRPRTWLVAAGVGIAAYALACPWLPPSNIRDVRRNAQFTVGNYPIGGEQALQAALLVAAVLALSIALRRTQTSKSLRFSALFTLAIGAIPVAAEWTGRYMVPQPERYHLEMEMGVALLFGIGFIALVRRSPAPVGLALVAVGLACGAYQTIEHRHYARGMTTEFDITRTVEYKTAHWIGENLPGRRIFATGSTQFWLNAFTDNPQIGGGFAQGIVNPTIPMVHFGVPYTIGDGERSAMWLRVYGAQAIVVSGPGSRDSYPGNFRDADKFKAVLPELWRDGGDAIFGVPQRSTSLAHVIRADDVVPRAAVNVEDVEPIRRYAAALEDESLPIARMVWERPNAMRINAIVSGEDLISVQESYRSGWHANTLGRLPAPIRPDGLGFMVLDPPCEGPCEIELVYDGGIEAKIAQLAAWTAFLAFPAWWFWRRRGPSANSPAVH